jgi:hypothetical protein
VILKNINNFFSNDLIIVKKAKQISRTFGHCNARSQFWENLKRNSNFFFLIIFWNDKNTMLIRSILGLLKISLEKRRRKKGWLVWMGIVAFAKSANWVWTLNFEPTQFCGLDKKAQQHPPTFPVDGYYNTFLLPFSFVPKALSEPAPTLVPWPQKKNKWPFLLVDGCHCGYITKFPKKIIYLFIYSFLNQLIIFKKNFFFFFNFKPSCLL